MSHMKCLSKCPYSKKSVSPRKLPGCAPVNFVLIFHPNFHTNAWVFATLLIYRKLNHDNISHVLYMRYKIVCTWKYLHWKFETYIICIYKYWRYSLCWCYFEENKNFWRKQKSLFIIFCVVAKFSKDIFPIVPISVITSISLISTQHYTRFAWIGSQSRKC